MSDDAVLRLAYMLIEVIDDMVEEVLPELRQASRSADPRREITDEDFRDSISKVLREFVVMLEGYAPSDEATVDDVVRRRYAQDVSLTQLLHGYRVCAAAVWKRLSSMVEGNAHDRDALLAVTPAIFERVDTVSLRAQEIYQALSVSHVRRNEQIRTSLLDILVTGDSGSGSEFWDAVSLLEVPRHGPFLVVDVVAPAAVASITDWEDIAAAVDAVDRAWFRLGVNSQVGIVSLLHDPATNDLGNALTEGTSATMGISALFDSVADCRRARTQAGVAAAATSSTKRVVRYDHDVLDILMASAPEAARQVLSSTLGPIMDLPHAAAQPLLNMVEAWLANGQSVTATATAQYCHRNTVKNRLRRFEEISGGSLSDNAWLGQVILALRGYRTVSKTFPIDGVHGAGTRHREDGTGRASS